METARSVTPKDFFLWLGIVISLYGSVVALISLLFEYINRSFPDPLAGYADPYASGAHVSMASLIVLVPLFFVLMHLVRESIRREPEKEHIWVRRWAIVLTLFISAAIVTVDLIVLLTTFLGGELTLRFLLKVATVLLVGIGIFLHFLAVRWGYWIKHPKHSRIVAVATIALTILTIAGGFYILGTPSDIRMLRMDREKLEDLQQLQWQIVEYYRSKEELPRALSALSNSLTGYTVPTDPQSGEQYRYEVTGELSFTLCAVFNRDMPDTQGQGSYPMRDMAYPSTGIEENWEYKKGETCYTRTIDPELYPPYAKPL